MMAFFFRVLLQLQADYEAAIAQYEIVVTAEASVMPRTGSTGSKRSSAT